MKSRNIFAFVFAMVILLIGVTPVGAIKTAPRSTGQFTLEVAEGELVRTDRTFALEKGEEVTIKASYTPFDANVDVGILNSATGTFYYQSTSDGTVDADTRASGKITVKLN